MTKLKQCKGAAEFLRIVYKSHYKRKCQMALNIKECFRKVHHQFGEMAEAYVMQSSLSDKQLNKCFSKPFNKLFQEIAGDYESAYDSYYED